MNEQLLSQNPLSVLSSMGVLVIAGMNYLATRNKTDNATTQKLIEHLLHQEKMIEELKTKDINILLEVDSLRTKLAETAKHLMTDETKLKEVNIL